MEGALQVPRKHSGAAAARGTSESMLAHGNPSDERSARLRAGVQGNSPTHCRHSCGRVLCCLRHALLACAQDSGAAGTTSCSQGHWSSGRSDGTAFVLRRPSGELTVCHLYRGIRIVYTTGLKAHLLTNCWLIV